MVVAVIGDGYVYGASEDGVASDLAAKLVKQGTPGQVFGDGYMAMAAVSKYLEDAPFYVSHDYDPETGYVYDSRRNEEYDG